MVRNELDDFMYAKCALTYHIHLIEWLVRGLNSKETWQILKSTQRFDGKKVKAVKFYIKM